MVMAMEWISQTPLQGNMLFRVLRTQTANNDGSQTRPPACWKLEVGKRVNATDEMCDAKI